MSKTMRVLTIVLGLVLLGALLVACGAQPEQVVVTQVVQVEVTRVIEKEGETIVVTEVVEREVVVTPTPAPMEPVSFKDPSPDTWTEQIFGDIDTMDPALAYDTASGALIQNVMETLIWYNFKDGTTYVPVLALEVPSVENGLISEDGLTYTFNIRPGVTFHEGGTLEASDVAYSFHRGMLQSDVNGPQWLLLEPLLGYTSGDVTEEIGDGEYAGDPDALKANATPEELIAVCEKVKASVVADNAAGTVTFNLAQPWGPFLATIAQTWGAVADEQWVIAQGDWDGSCETWADFYSPGAENTKLGSVINGTGPYKLQRWTPGEGYTLMANESYWRAADNPMWEGGPSGAPRMKTVNVVLVNEWGTRFAALQAGDAEVVSVPTENRVQVDQFVGEFCNWQTDECTPNPANPDGRLRKFAELPSVSRTDVFLNFNVPADSPYIGSGQLDGNGIPPEFFSDVRVRRAMAYCFDYDTYIAEVQNGEGVRNNGPIIQDMLGYNEDGPMYEFDLDQCAAELEAAWDGQVAANGFRFQIAYNTGNTGRQTIAEIFQASLGSINAAYRVEAVGLPWPTLLRQFRARQLPVAVSGWVEDIHDPHNWVQPYTLGTFAGRQNLPEDLKAQFQELVNAGVLASDPAEREQYYFQLQQLYYDTVPTVILSQQTGVHYEQRWVQDWYFRVGSFGDYYYAFGLDG